MAPFTSRCLSTTIAHAHAPFLEAAAPSGRTLWDPLARVHPSSGQTRQGVERPHGSPAARAQDSALYTLLSHPASRGFYSWRVAGLIIVLCFLLILVGIYLLAEGKVSSKLRQTTFLEAQKERSDTICADKMETRFASPQPLQQVLLPSHKAPTWLPSQSQAYAAALTLGFLSTWHHRGHQAQTFRNNMTLCGQPPRNVLIAICKGFQRCCPFPTCWGWAMMSTHGRLCHPQGTWPQRALQQGRAWLHSLPWGQKTSSQEAKCSCPWWCGPGVPRTLPLPAQHHAWPCAAWHSPVPNMRPKKTRNQRK